MVENQEQDELSPFKIQLPDSAAIPGKRPSLRAWQKVFAWLLVVAIIIAVPLLLRDKVYQPLSKTGQAQTFTVEKGQKFIYISRHLYNRGLISNTLLFDIYGYLSGRAGMVAVGDFSLSPKMSMHEILYTLTPTPDAKKQITVRIREGATLDDIAAYLDENEVVTKTEFLNAAKAKAQTFNYLGETPRNKSLEGYLFPDTYFFEQGANANDIIDRLLNTMDKRITPKMRSDLQSKSMTIYDVLTMASIIEKEVGRNTATLTEADQQTLDQERKDVASVFYNRLRAGMALQSDATVTYITKKKDPSASAADTQIDSPYNTYKYRGLPLGPISAPSLSSIEAAIYPSSTSYMYFLTRPDGTAVFAKTLDEQNANKAKYLK